MEENMESMGVDLSEREAAIQEQTREQGADGETVWNRLSEELTALHNDGWSVEQMQAFSQDERAQRAIAAGATVRQAATAYLMHELKEKTNGKEVMQEAHRMQPDAAQAQQEREEERGRNRKRGVPALRTATTSSVPQSNAIERLSSSEFAKFSDEIYARLLAGEKIAL